MEHKYIKYLSKGLYFIPGIKSILLCRLFGGLYYTVGSNRLINFAARVLCVVITSFVTFNYVRLFPLTANASLVTKIVQLIQYIGDIVVNLIFSGDHFMDFLSSIRIIDVALDFKPTHEVLFSRLVWIFTLTWRIVAVLLFWSYYSIFLGSHLMVAIAEVWLECTVCCSHFTRIMIFELLLYRIKVLRKRFEIDLSKLRRFVESDKQIKDKINKCVKIYVELLKTVHETDFPIKSMIFLSIGGVGLKMMVIVFRFINGNYSIFTLVAATEIFIESTLPFIPAVLAGMVNNEVDKIKLIVTKQLLLCRGEKGREVAEDMVTFFEQRSFRYTIWRLYDVDVPVILTAVSIITTYTVAMIQFAHFYD